jgi:translation initiation factor eIF-2B subunit beta
MARHDHEHRHREIIMTLGHSRTVEAFLKAAARKRKFTVVVIETAPSYARSSLEGGDCALTSFRRSFTGRQLALALSTADPPIDAVLIPDAAVFALMSRCSKVLLGAHSVLADGSLLAIAGSLPAVRAAKAHLVPVVCCAGMFKFAPRFLGEAAYGALDWGSPAEVLKPIETPAIAEILNPYYDRVPSELISLFVTNMYVALAFALPC